MFESLGNSKDGVMEMLWCWSRRTLWKRLQLAMCSSLPVTHGNTCAYNFTKPFASTAVKSESTD